MTQPHLGKRLREIRQERQLSIAETAAAADLSPSFLSLLEKGKSDIAIGRLMRLTSFLGVGLEDVLPPTVSTPYELIHSGEHRSLPSQDEGIEVQLMTNSSDHQMMPVIATYEVGGETAEHLDERGETFFMTLQGEITIELDDAEQIVLRKGDTAYIPRGTSRSFRNTSRGRSVLFGVLARELR